MKSCWDENKRLLSTQKGCWDNFPSRDHRAKTYNRRTAAAAATVPMSTQRSGAIHWRTSGDLVSGVFIMLARCIGRVMAFPLC